MSPDDLFCIVAGGNFEKHGPHQRKRSGHAAVRGDRPFGCRIGWHAADSRRHFPRGIPRALSLPAQRARFRSDNFTIEDLRNREGGAVGPPLATIDLSSRTAPDCFAPELPIQQWRNNHVSNRRQFVVCWVRAAYRSLHECWSRQCSRLLQDGWRA